MKVVFFKKVIRCLPQQKNLDQVSETSRKQLLLHQNDQVFDKYYQGCRRYVSSLVHAFRHPLEYPQLFVIALFIQRQTLPIFASMFFSESSSAKLNAFRASSGLSLFSSRYPMLTCGSDAIGLLLIARLKNLKA